MCQLLCYRLPHVADAQGIEHALIGHTLRLLNALQQVCRAGLAPAVESQQLIILQSIEVGGITNQPFLPEQ